MGNSHIIAAAADKGQQRNGIHSAHGSRHSTAPSHVETPREEFFKSVRAESSDEEDGYYSDSSEEAPMINSYSSTHSQPRGQKQAQLPSPVTKRQSFLRKHVPPLAKF